MKKLKIIGFLVVVLTSAVVVLKLNNIALDNKMKDLKEELEFRKNNFVFNDKVQKATIDAIKQLDIRLKNLERT